MKIAGISAIYYNNILRSNTDTKAKYSDTPEIPQDCFVKSTSTQPTKAQNVSFGGFFGVSDSVFYDMQEVLKKRASRNNRSKGHEEIKERELALA